ncbi:MAG: oxygen-independent coproporphyrinogen III oxidase [Lachnospiraceae bacterium]|nr:oxygen-independent coproporphyrinogen III oxidase [Lachnospiraceae bacterium]
MNSTKLSGIYIHIPFCVRKCLYCDFLSFSNMEDRFDDYVQALIREIRMIDYNEPVDSIFFGGGTPSVLKSDYIKNILDELYKKFDIADDCEISMEMNPATLTINNLKGYVEAGINRASIGMQSTNNEELKALGRIHLYNDFLKAYEYVRNVGITNVNVDIMSAIPGQTVKSYEQTLDRVMRLKPEHISSYSLILEEGTPFYEMDNKGLLVLPGEEDERIMYHMTKDVLASEGYLRYEISNYSRANYESRHNIKYWRRQDYIGLGLGAASLVGNKRYNNTSDIREYIRNAGFGDIRINVEELTKENKIEETMYLGLRMMSGVNKREFFETFDMELEKIYGNVIKNLEKEKLIKNDEKSIVLTEFGVDVSNRVLSEFLLDIL